MKVPEPENKAQTATWAFLTNHAAVLLCIARDPRIRARDIAQQIGITKRAAQRILADLITDGYVTRTKVGRRNDYTIDRRARLRDDPLVRDLSIGPCSKFSTERFSPTPSGAVIHRPSLS